MAEPKTPAALALLALAERGQHWVDDLGGDDDARAAMYATEVVEAVRRSVISER